MSGKTIGIIVAILAVAGVGYWYWKKHSRAGRPFVQGIPPMAPGGSAQQAAAAKSKGKKGWKARLGSMAKGAVKGAAVASGIPGAQQALYVAGV
jgi:hypothetical protein